MSILARRLMSAAGNAGGPNTYVDDGGLAAQTTTVYTEPFLTEDRLATLSGVSITVNSPTKYGSNPVLTDGGVGASDETVSYVSVINRADGFHMFYTGFDSATSTPRAHYASSDDGITWTKPDDLGYVTFDGDTNNNILFEGYASQVLYDTDSAKWIAVDEVSSNNQLKLWTADTPDGTWTNVKTLTGSVGDECKGLVRRPTDGVWVLYFTRGHAGNTRKQYVWTSDTTSLTGAWTARDSINNPIVIDTAGSSDQSYSLATRRDGKYVYAINHRFNATTSQIDTDLQVSYEGTRWTKVADGWITVGASTAWDDEIVFGASFTEIDADTWRVYYGGSADDHATLPRDSGVGFATIDKHRIGSIGSTGSVTTEPIKIASGATLTVNVDASGGGSLDIEVQDSSGSPITGFAEADFDTITTDGAFTPTWAGSEMPDDRNIILKFVLSGATLYHFQISDATVNLVAEIEDLVSWHDLFFADDPEMTDIQLTTGNAIAGGNWPEMIAGRDASQATSSQWPYVYRDDANYNNRTNVAQQSGFSGDLLQQAAYTAITQPITIVAIGFMRGTGSAAGSFFYDGITSTDRASLFHRDSNNNVSMFGGSQVNGGAKDADVNVWIATFDGASSTLEKNGSAFTSGNAGTDDLTGLTIMGLNNGGTSFTGGSVGLLAVLDGTLTSGEKSSIVSWAQSFYGTP